MTKYVIKRILLAFISLFIILSLTFILMKTLPMDIPQGVTPDVKLAFLIKQSSNGYLVYSVTPLQGYGDPVATVKLITSDVTHYFYNRPIMEQYFSWLKGIFTRWD